MSTIDPQAEWTAKFQGSKTPWFRARTYHEYGIVSQWCGSLVDFNRASILDFGCGVMPIAAASFALRHPDAKVAGVDILPIDHGNLQAVLLREAGTEIPDNLQFNIGPDETFDLVYSWSVFEHIRVDELESCFQQVRERMTDDGLFFFQIGGLYHSNVGSHLNRFFPNNPWHHLTMSIAELQEVAGANQREWQQFIELNRLTADDFIDAATKSGLRVLRDERLKTEEQPPNRLLRSYRNDTLRTFEIRTLFARSGI